MADRQRKAGTFANDDEANAAKGSTVNEGPHKTDDEANVAQGSVIEVSEETHTKVEREDVSRGDNGDGEDREDR